MKKRELIEFIKEGICPQSYKQDFIGQGMGFKADVVITDKCLDDEEVVYIPEFGYNDAGLPEIDSIYTRKDLLEICKGDEDVMEFMFETLDWQYPETLYQEWECNDILDKHFTKESKVEKKQNTIEVIGEKYDWNKVNWLSKSIVFLVIAIAILYFLPFIVVLIFSVILFGISERLFGGGKSIIKESDTKNE